MLGLDEIIHFVLLRAVLLQVQQVLRNRRARLGGDLTCTDAKDDFIGSWIASLKKWIVHVPSDYHRVNGCLIRFELK